MKLVGLGARNVGKSSVAERLIIVRSFGSIYAYKCGCSLVVKCLPSKQKTRVRFSLPAQNKKLDLPRSSFLFIDQGRASKLLCLRRESKTFLPTPI